MEDREELVAVEWSVPETEEKGKPRGLYGVEEEARGR